MKKQILFKIIVMIVILLHIVSCEKITVYGDVVIKIENESTMKSYLLIAKEQQILMIE